ncbi:hypothetical protein P4B35_22000 [Pontiellaceae bacterium B12227]|nr:hypothetical protein [Pontiellaceae bacterium B12227]
MLNRSAITVKAKQPFMDWLGGLPDPVDSSVTLETVTEEQPVYLVPECIDPDMFPEMLTYYFDVIFEAELSGWWTDRKDWPQSRTVELFQEWFDIEFHSMVEDLGTEELQDDE